MATSHSKFSKHFTHTLSALGLERLPLTLGCLRAGGATAAYLNGVALNDLKFRGRWRQETSLEIYVQEAMSHLCACLTDDEHHALSTLNSASTFQWSNPPSIPWTDVSPRGLQWRGQLAAAPRARKRSSKLSVL